MIFLDTSYLRGLLLKKDPYHESSKNIQLLLEKESKAINLTVVVELLNFLNHRNYNKNVDQLLDCLMNLDSFDFLTMNDYCQSFDIYKFYGRRINFADCTIINTMVNHNITRIASFDSDFDKIKGFQRIC